MPPTAPRTAASKRARPASTSNGSGAVASRPSAALARARRRAGQRAWRPRATAVISAIVAVAVQDHVAAGGQRARWRARSKSPLERLHRQVVAHQQAVEADLAADDLARSRVREVVAGRSGSMAAIDHMGGHRHRHVGVAPGTARNRAPPAPPGAPRPPAALRWLSAWARPWPGMCLITGRTPPAISPSAAARPSAPTSSAVSAVGAVADDVVGAGLRHVQHRRAVDVDADGGEVVGDQPRAQPGDLAPQQRIVGRPARHRRGPADSGASAAAPAAARARPPGRSAPARPARRRSRAGPSSAPAPGPASRRCA